MSKWTNTSAGKIQCNRFNKAWGALNWERNTSVELGGTVGGNEYRTAITKMIGTDDGRRDPGRPPRRDFLVPELEYCGDRGIAENRWKYPWTFAFIVDPTRHQEVTNHKDHVADARIFADGKRHCSVCGIALDLKEGKLIAA